MIIMEAVEAAYLLHRTSFAVVTQEPHIGDNRHKNEVMRLS